jgi:hypothetical protein
VAGGARATQSSLLPCRCVARDASRVLSGRARDAAAVRSRAGSGPCSGAPTPRQLLAILLS